MEIVIDWDNGWDVPTMPISWPSPLTSAEWRLTAVNGVVEQRTTGSRRLSSAGETRGQNSQLDGTSLLSV
jgi:hypothetical protein